jgi:hypothetical protein
MGDGRWARGPPGGERESKRGPPKKHAAGYPDRAQRGGICKSWRTMRLFSSPPGDVLACVLASGWEGEGPLDERGTKDQGRGPAKRERGGEQTGPPPQLIYVGSCRFGLGYRTTMTPSEEEQTVQLSVDRGESKERGR